MTGNTAQAIADPQQWRATLAAVHAALRPGAHLVFETRDPTARGWEHWNKEATHRTVELSGVGAVTSWVEQTALDWPLVSFRWTWVFAQDGATLTSESTLGFREQDELPSGVDQGSAFGRCEWFPSPSRTDRESLCKRAIHQDRRIEVPVTA